MKRLRTFLMEDHLEAHRFTARFNLGESGGRPRIMKEFVEGAGLDARAASDMFLSLSLRDSPNWGRDDLRDSIAALHPGATRENVLVTTGTSEALLLLFRRLAPRKVAMAVPAFQLLYEIPMALGATLVPLPIRWSEEAVPSIDADMWLKILARENPDCIVINNPHNPSGLLFDEALLRAISDHAERTGASLIFDEHYRFLSSDEAVAGASGYAQNERTFATGSFTKCLGAPGLRVGWCVGPSEILADMQSEKNYTTHTVNPVSEWLAATLLADLKLPGFAQARVEWKQNRKVLADFLEKSRTLQGVSPQGGLVTAVGFRAARTRAQFELFLKALLQGGVFCLPLESMEFGPTLGATDPTAIEQGLGVRLGLGVNPPEFAEALSVMEQLLMAAGGDVA